MAMLAEPTFTIVTKENKDLLETFKNNDMIGYISFQNDKNEIQTQKIHIKNIQDVYNCGTGEFIETYVSYSYMKEVETTLFFFFKSKHLELVDVESGFYSKDLYSCYDPYGMLTLDVVHTTIENSLTFYFNNIELSNKYAKRFK